MWVVPDFETLSGCDLKKAGAWRYAEDPTTNIIVLRWRVGDGPILRWFPDEPLPAVLRERIDDPKTVFVAHNAEFEKAIWRRILVPLYGWPDIPNERWHDTAARCANLALPRGLEKVLPLLSLPVQKDMEGNRLTLGLSRINKKTGMYPPLTDAVRERVSDYCAIDVEGQSALHKRIGWLPPEERVTYLLDQEINERGLALDVPLIRAMRKIVDEASRPLIAEFAELTGGLTLNQVAKVGEWCKDRGVELPNLQKETLDALFGETDEGETVDETLNVELPPEVHRALYIRRLIGSASVKKLAAMEACVGSDGRARGLLVYHRANTGRWAGQLLQPQNFPRGTIKGDIEGMVAALMTGDHEYVNMLYGPPVETVVSSLRHAVIAAPGHALVAGDFAGIEARVVLALAGQHDKTELLASGADVYISMAQDIYNLPKFDVSDKELCKKFKAEHLEERQIGKNTILGCGFQMGANKFHGRYCPKQPVEFAQQVVDTYRKVWAPKVPELWRGLEQAAVKAVHYRKAHEAYGIVYQLEDEWLTARLPSGRKLWYFQPRATRRAMPWDENDIRLAWTYKAWKQGRMLTVDAYGGLLTENVVQAIARDLLVVAMRRCRREGLPMVLTVHDELVLELPEARADEAVLKEIMEDIPDWAKALKVPVEVETWAGDRYRK